MGVGQYRVEKWWGGGGGGDGVGVGVVGGGVCVGRTGIRKVVA